MLSGRWGDGGEGDGDCLARIFRKTNWKCEGCWSSRRYYLRFNGSRGWVADRIVSLGRVYSGNRDWRRDLERGGVSPRLREDRGDPMSPGMTKRYRLQGRACYRSSDYYTKIKRDVFWYKYPCRKRSEIYRSLERVEALQTRRIDHKPETEISWIGNRTAQELKKKCKQFI